MNRRRFLESAGTIVLTPWLVGFGSNMSRSIAGTTMGTFFKIDFEDSAKGVQVEHLKRDVRLLLERIENRMSLYRRSSELCRFNSVNNLEWQPISLETAKIIRVALDVGEQSLGTFNCTVGATSRYWGFGPVSAMDTRLVVKAPSETPPAPKGVELSVNTRYLRKISTDSELDLNAIAKGDTVDQVALLLTQYGLTRYLVEIGGEFYGSVKHADEDPWTIGIAHPEGGVVDTVHLSGKAIATSGDYIHERHLGKRRLTHLIDPKTGEPIDSSLALVSVIADTAIQADAWATALQVMGLENGMLFAKQNDMAAFFLNRESGGYVAYATNVFNQHRVTGAGGAEW